MSYIVCKRTVESIFRSLRKNKGIIQKYNYFRIPYFEGPYDMYYTKEEYKDALYMSNQIEKDFKVLVNDYLPTVSYDIIPEKKKIVKKIFQEYNKKYRLPFNVDFSHCCPIGAVYEFNYYYIDTRKL